MKAPRVPGKGRGGAIYPPTYARPRKAPPSPGARAVLATDPADSRRYDPTSVTISVDGRVIVEGGRIVDDPKPESTERLWAKVAAAFPGDDPIVVVGGKRLL